MGLWSFLRSLWPWRRRRQPPPVPPAAVRAEPELRVADEVLAREPAVETADPPIVADTPAGQVPVEAAPPEPLPLDEPSAEDDAGEEPTGEAAADVYVWTVPEGADEDEGWEDEDEDFDGPDPFISGEPGEDEPVDVDLEERRAAARAEALEGEQRIYMRTPAGPGSLAEALHQLMAEGLVQAEFVDAADDEPHILYRPVKGLLSEG